MKLGILKKTFNPSGTKTSKQNYSVATVNHGIDHKGITGSLVSTMNIFNYKFWEVIENTNSRLCCITP